MMKSIWERCLTRYLKRSEMIGVGLEVPATENISLNRVVQSARVAE